jgi:6-methylsalicylate decarboxylase
MDKFDVAVAILSLTQMGDALYDGTEMGRANVRMGNEYGAKLMADHPKRFGLFSAIPLPDLDGSLKELETGWTR